MMKRRPILIAALFLFVCSLTLSSRLDSNEIDTVNDELYSDYQGGQVSPFPFCGAFPPSVYALCLLAESDLTNSSPPRQMRLVSVCGGEKAAVRFKPTPEVITLELVIALFFLAVLFCVCYHRRRQATIVHNVESRPTEGLELAQDNGAQQMEPPSPPPQNPQGHDGHQVAQHQRRALEVSHHGPSCRQTLRRAYRAAIKSLEDRKAMQPLRGLVVESGSDYVKFRRAFLKHYPDPISSFGSIPELRQDAVRACLLHERQYMSPASLPRVCASSF